jgi:hypothetical protein
MRAHTGVKRQFCALITTANSDQRRVVILGAGMVKPPITLESDDYAPIASAMSARELHSQIVAF